MEQPIFADLLEEGMRQASRAPSEKRLAEIATVLADGIKAENTAVIDRAFLLQLLGELNDTEVIILSGLGKLGKERDAFYAAHAAALDADPPMFAQRAEDSNDRWALRQGYENHLERLNLIRDTEGTAKSHRYLRKWEVTDLGRLLLRMIGAPSYLDT